MKVSDVLRILSADGWALVATRGSHRQFKHASKPGRVTVRLGNRAMISHLARTTASLKQAGLKS